MKKICVSLVALAFATLSFAQVDNLPFSKQTVKTSDELEAIIIPTHHNPSKGANASQWFSYFPTFYEKYSGLEFGNNDYRGVIMNCDTNAQVKFTDGSYTVQFNGFGQVFNFGNIFWQDVVRNWYQHDGTSIPDMTSATSYSVDSVAISYGYRRGTAQDPTVVDTVIISVLGDLTEENLAYTQHSAGFVYTGIGYDTTKFELKDIAGAKREVIKVPLTVSDSTTFVQNGQLLIKFVDMVVPVTGFTNLSNKNLVVFYTFKPGTPTDHNKFLGVDYGRFLGVAFRESRTDYLNVGEVMKNERNNSIHAFTGTFNANWAETLPPLNLFWKFEVVNNQGVDGMRPAILAKITCDDCTMGSIKDMTHKNITIQPNPATCNFTVDLGTVGKSNIEMFNLVGQKVYSTTTHEASIQVNVSDYKSGVYMLKINKNGKTYTSKVVVK